MRSLLVSALVGALLVGGGVAATTATATSADAVTRTAVVVKHIPTKTAPYRGKVTVKPLVASTGHVKVTKKIMTVKHGSRTVASKKTSVRVVAGTYRVWSKAYFRTYHVRTSHGVSHKVWSTTKSKTLVQKLVVKPGKRPSATSPVSAWNCPSWAPIKGNASSHIYHLPGGRWYTRTKPEICFTTTSAARAHGYRASKNG